MGHDVKQRRRENRGEKILFVCFYDSVVLSLLFARTRAQEYICIFFLELYDTQCHTGGPTAGFPVAPSMSSIFFFEILLLVSARNQFVFSR